MAASGSDRAADKHMQKQNTSKKVGGRRMTMSVSRRSLLALGADFSASAMFGDGAPAKAPKLGTQSP
jgi:hypothetical protein